MKSHETQVSSDDWDEEITGEAGLFRKSDGTLVEGPIIPEVVHTDNSSPGLAFDHKFQERLEGYIDEIEKAY